MYREHLVITPFFRIETPPLGFACLQAYLKQYDIKLGFTDYRLRKNTMDITSGNVGYKFNYAGDLQDLPLIQTIAANFLNDKPLLDNMDEAIRNYIKARPISYFKVKEDIKDVYRIFKQDINNLSKCSLIGFTTYATNIFSTILLACMLKQKNPDITIVFGGPQTSESEETSEIVLRLGIADVIGIGDGEEVLRQIIEADRAGNSLAVAGTLTFDKVKQKLRRIKSPILDIQNLPCPDFSGMELAKYAMSPATLPLYTSRGCPYKCEFCNEPTMWKKYRRFKSVERVIDWMEQLNKKYGTVRFFMADSLLNASERWADKFARTLISRKLNYQWYGYYRVDNVTLDFAKILKKSGMCRAFIGSEAYNEDTLKAMKKQATVDDNAKATEAFCTAGIPLEISNVIGFPGESEKDFQAKLQFYFDLSKKHTGTFSVNSETFRFVPGSGIYKHPDEFNIKVINWNKKIINAIPQISQVVARMPMAIKSKPNATTILRWANLIRTHFQPDHYSSLNYQNKMNEGMRKIQVNNLSKKSVVKFSKDFHLINIVKDKIIGINYKQKPMYMLSAVESTIYRSLQNNPNIEKALSFLQKTQDSTSIADIKKLLNKLIAAGIQPNINTPVLNVEPEKTKKPIKKIKVSNR